MNPMRRRHKHWNRNQVGLFRVVFALRSWVVLFGLLGGVALTLGAGRVAGAQIAVADFEVPDSGASGADVAFGLADVLAVELQQRGVTLWERQQIRLVLGERRLTASGLMQLRKTAGPEIPDLDYLATGRIWVESNHQFRLETALVETRSGRNAASFSVGGKTSGELAPALAGLAAEMATWLATATPGAIQVPPVRARVNRKPEVSLLFYKGVAYCLAGQPELGVTWFIDAQKADPAYLAARFWTVRAFEMIGLPDFAAVARRKLQQAPGGQELLNQLNQASFRNRGLGSVAVLADPRLDSAGQRFQIQLKTALGNRPNLFVADPGNIHALAAEMDLQLAELGGRDLELNSVLWSMVDALVLVKAEDPPAGHYSVELCEATSGEVRFRLRSGTSATDVNETARRLVNQIVATLPGSPAARSGPSLRLPRALKPAQVSNTDRNEFAGLLRYLSENPSDRAAWLRLALFVPWLSGRSDGSYECLMFDRVSAATDLSKPDAAHWLSEALWQKNAYGGVTSVAKEGAVLLERFPKTPEGCYVRSALALELLDQQKYAAAAAILLQLAEELPRLPASLKIAPDYWANFYFFTAVALRETGAEMRAREFLDRAGAVLRANPDMLIHDGNTYRLGVWVNHFPRRHPLFGPNREVRQAVAEWQLKLQPATFASGAALSLEQLEVLLTRTKQSAAAETWSHRVAFLQRLIEHMRANPKLYQGRIDESTWQGAYREVEVWPVGWMSGHFSLPGKLVMEATTLLHRMASGAPERLGELRGLAEQIAQGLDPQVAANCFEAVGDFTRALELVETAIEHPSPFPPSPNMHPTPSQTAAKVLRQKKIRLLQKLDQAGAAAAYACEQAELNHPDADAQWSAILDAVNACDAAGRGDQARGLLLAFVRDQEARGAVTSQSAVARIHWADREIAAGNQFEASEILRTVVKASEGKGWGVSLRTGYARVYDAATARLAKLRPTSTFTAGPFTARSSDWERPPQRPRAVPPIPPRHRTQLEQQLETILRGRESGDGSRTFGGAAVTEFAQQYGRAAVPAVLAAARENESNARLVGTSRLLDRIATAADAPAVLEGFKQSPFLAEPAFRLDRTNAAIILRERFPIYATGGNVPRELRRVLAEYSLLDQYPVLIANLAAKDPDGNTAALAGELDAMLRTNAPPALLEAYRIALITAIERQMLSTYRRGLANLGEIALRRGWSEGIAALLQGNDPTAGDVLPRLRKYLDLPADDAQARAELEAHLGNWQWNPAARKFGVTPSRSMRTELKTGESTAP